jgi:hypothetical protein
LEKERKVFGMSKVEDFLNAVKLGEIMHTKKEEERRANTWLIILGIIGIIITVGIVAYTVYKVLTPEELDEEFDDEFEDGFNDFEDEDDELCLRKVPKPLRVVNDSDYDSDDED